MLTKRLTVEEGVIFRANPTSPGGKSATLDGPLTANVLSGTPHDPVFSPGTPENPEEPNCITIWAPDEQGTLVVEVDGDADLGEGVEFVRETVELVAIPANAAKLNATLTTVPKPT